MAGKAREGNERWKNDTGWFGMGRRSATIKGPMPLFWQGRKIKRRTAKTRKFDPRKGK